MKPLVLYHGGGCRDGFCSAWVARKALGEIEAVPVSYYAHPLLSELYPGWTQIDCSRQKNLHVQNRRGMGASVAPEVLLVNGKAYQ